MTHNGGLDVNTYKSEGYGTAEAVGYARQAAKHEYRFQANYQLTVAAAKRVSVRSQPSVTADRVHTCETEASRNHQCILRVQPTIMGLLSQLKAFKEREREPLVVFISSKC